MTGAAAQAAATPNLVEQTQRIVEQEIAPRADATDREARWPAENMQALARAGLTGLAVPAEHGGMGLGLWGLAQVCETIATACPSTALCFGMHCVATAVLAARATADQVERFLVPIAAGHHLTTLALSEIGTGAEFYLPHTRLHDEPDGFLVDGEKDFVTSGGHADSYVISVTDGTACEPGRFSCLVIEAERLANAWGPPWAGLGMRGNSSRSVALHDVPVPRGNLLGRQGDQIWFVFEVVAPWFLIAMASTYSGIARAAVDIASADIAGRVRIHTATTLAHEPVVQTQQARAFRAVVAARALVQSAAMRADEGEPDAALWVMAAKAQATETAVTVVNSAMDLCGGRAYREGHRLARLLRDARAGNVMSPTSNLLEMWIGRSLLGVPML